jgi:hypothetical protein
MALPPMPDLTGLAAIPVGAARLLLGSHAATTALMLAWGPRCGRAAPSTDPRLFGATVTTSAASRANWRG